MIFLVVINFQQSLICDTSISDFKNKKTPEIYKIKKKKKPTIARIFDNFSSNDCCYHTENDENRQFIEKFLRIDLETAPKIEEKPLGQSTNDSLFMESKND